MSEFKTIDIPKGGGRKSKWAAIAAEIRTLPEGKALEIQSNGSAPICSSLKNYSLRVRVAKIDVNTYAVWENRDAR